MDNRKYINTLEKYLRKLPPEDRADAIVYYSEYLAEAGPDGARIALDTLGTPAQVAAGIMAEYSMKNLNEGKPKVKKGISAVWFAVIGVFALPIGLPIAIAIVCIVFALLVSLLAIFISLYIVGASMFFGGLAVIAGGIVIEPQAADTAVFYMGGGLALTGVSILWLIGITALTRITLKGIAKLFNAIRFRNINKQIRKNMEGKPVEYANPDLTVQTQTQAEAGSQDGMGAIAQEGGETNE